MKTIGTPEEILEQLVPDRNYPELPGILERARELVKFTKREIWRYQAYVLYALVMPYNIKGVQVLEIGTATGYSAAILAQAASNGRVITLNPKQIEFVQAVDNLRVFHNVFVERIKSYDYLVQWQHLNQALDVVFIDGDHGRVAMDLDWFNELKTGGLILFHDYSPTGSKRACQPVYDICNAMRDSLGRDFDIEIIDHQKVGMVGFYRQRGETFGGISQSGDGWKLVGGEWQDVK